MGTNRRPFVAPIPLKSGILCFDLSLSTMHCKLLLSLFILISAVIALPHEQVSNDNVGTLSKRATSDQEATWREQLESHFKPYQPLTYTDGPFFENKAYESTVTSLVRSIPPDDHEAAASLARIILELNDEQRSKAWQRFKWKSDLIAQNRAIDSLNLRELFEPHLEGGSPAVREEFEKSFQSWLPEYMEEVLAEVHPEIQGEEMEEEVAKLKAAISSRSLIPMMESLEKLYQVKILG